MILSAAITDSSLTFDAAGVLVAVFFVLAYSVVMLEERLHLRKSAPVILAAGSCWMVLSMATRSREALHESLLHSLLEFAELFLFLLAAMTYVNTLEERGVFECLRRFLIRRNLSLAGLFWVTGAVAFGLSPLADNLTTALVMAAVVRAVGGDNPRFVSLGFINVVVAANAGGVFSPFGDITTLMVWQQGKVSFGQFFCLLGPALANWLIPAAAMAWTLGPDMGSRPPEGGPPREALKVGAGTVAGLLLATIALAVLLHAYLGLPPFLGMTTGLAALKLYGWSLERWESKLEQGFTGEPDGVFARVISVDIFKMLERVEWDTLMFFYGIILTVGALGYAGHLALASAATYQVWGPLWANLAVGPVSAVLDNIPVMAAVLTMDPSMSVGHWLLVTLTAGVGGSLLSIGSAAGVALMGQARGAYTFLSHLRWTPAILVGYAVSVGVHCLLNASLF